MTDRTGYYEYHLGTRSVYIPVNIINSIEFKVSMLLDNIVTEKGDPCAFQLGLITTLSELIRPVESVSGWTDALQAALQHRVKERNLATIYVEDANDQAFKELVERFLERPI